MSRQYQKLAYRYPNVYSTPFLSNHIKFHNTYVFTFLTHDSAGQFTHKNPVYEIHLHSLSSICWGGKRTSSKIVHLSSKFSSINSWIYFRKYTPKISYSLHPSAGKIYTGNISYQNCKCLGGHQMAIRGKRSLDVCIQIKFDYKNE